MITQGWDKLRKDKSKVSKVLKDAGLSPALVQLRWASLTKSDRAKIGRVAKGKGWHEAQVPVITKKGIKKKAPVHRRVAIKKSLKSTLRKPLQKAKKSKPPHEKEHKGTETGNAEKYATVFLQKNPIELSDIEYYKGMALQGRKNPHGIADAVWRDAWRKVGLAGDIMIIGSDGSMYDTPYSVDGIIVNQKYVKAKEAIAQEPTTSHEPVQELSVPDPTQDDSVLEQVKKAGIDMDGLYVDDTNGIRLRILEGDLKGKAAHRCPECDRGLNWNKTKSVFTCGEHGSIAVDKTVDMRKIFSDKDTKKWAIRVLGNFVEDARVEGFKTVKEYADSLSDTEKDGIKQWVMLGAGLEKMLPLELAKINKDLDNSIFKTVSNRIDEAYKEFDTTGELTNFKEAWENEFKKYYEAVPEDDKKQLTIKLDGLTNYVYEKKKEKKKAEEDNDSSTIQYLKKELQYRLDAMDNSPIPMLHDTNIGTQEAINFARTSPVAIDIIFSKLKIRIRFYQDDKKIPISLTVTVFDLDGNQLYTNPEYNMDFTVEELFRVKSGIEKDLMEAVAEKTKKEFEEIEKQKVKKQYFIRLPDNTRELAESAYPFNYEGVNMFVHPVKVDGSTVEWHVSDERTGIMLAKGYNSPDAEFNAAKLFRDRGADVIKEKLAKVE